eukprot:s1849_g8.t1
MWIFQHGQAEPVSSYTWRQRKQLGALWFGQRLPHCLCNMLQRLQPTRPRSKARRALGKGSCDPALMKASENQKELLLCAMV